ncbi:hypothetical protein VC83_03351 [Pseudogymnoascus destructans]|uniref:Uncharacterized protein n=1 Tax=Pseudogymnoascus destructans TaxID=655981 RepID=A0A177AF25_9PEZI|nr:uncharacterized protein VC83_03351 [Pseudogymnoascus destructans]OAF60708.1 hypothetical protein VC83_03351 [Pseudogymnoascus destructans]
MVAALKTASETALQIQIEAVAVTAPWMVALDNQFLDVVHDVVRAIPALCASESRTAEWKENGKADHVELVIPDDRTYGASKGAAFWLRTRMDRTYCAEEGISDQYDMIGDTHVEL